MPMFFTGREPDDISGVNCFNRAAFALHASAARSHNERLPQRMRMPSRTCPRLKGDAGAKHPCWCGGIKQRINPHRAREVFRRPLAGSPRAASFDFHGFAA